MARQIRYGDMTIAVPDDASDAEVQSIIETKEVESKAKPFKPGPLEAAGRSLANYGQSIKDAATAPGGGPTGINLVDAAAGVADFGASMVTDAVTAVPRIASHVFAGARGSNKPYSERVEDFTRKPVTPVGNAIQNTVGAAMAPIGTAISATGASPDAAALGLDVAGTALDVVGLGAAARGAKAGVRGARTAAGAPDLPIPTPDGAPLRPFGPAVEKARRLDYRVTPGQVRARALDNMPEGDFNIPHVPGRIGQGLAGPAFEPMAIIDNQKRTNRYAAKELGISEITPQGLALAKNPHNAVFNEVARSVPNITPDEALTTALNALGEARRSNPLLKNSNDVELLRERLLAAGPVPTQKVLDAIREYRRDASTLYKRLGDPEAEQQAAAYRAAADALEDAIERQAGVLDPSLVPRLKDARTALAKIHNVEDALDGTNVDALRLARIGEKFPLSGYLADIAEIARDFPQTMKSATGVDIPEPSLLGSIWSASLMGRRLGGEAQGPRVLSTPYQNKFGQADPTYDPRPAPTPVTGSPFTEYTPPAGDVPGGADVMPPAPGGGPGLTATSLADDFDQLPPAEAFPGDLTAETPPMGGSLPPADLDTILTDLGLEPPLPARTADTVDFSPTQIEPVSPLDDAVPNPAPGSGLADDLVPPMTDQELLDIQLQTALPPGAEPPAMPPRRPPPPGDEDLGAAMVEPEGPPPQGPAPAGGEMVDLTDQVMDMIANTGPKPRELADDFELSVEDAPARPTAADLADDGLKLEDLPKRRPGDVAIKVTRNPPADIIPRKPLPPNPIVYHSGPARNPSRWLVLEDKGDSWQIRSIDTTGFKAENKGYHRGPGRELYLMAAKDAQRAGRKLNSDTDMTVDAIDAIERAVKDGELMVDDWDNAIAAARKQIEESGGKRASRGEKGGEPWFKNIRPGPAS